MSPKTLAELEQALAERFTCVDGPAKAWFNVDGDPARKVIYQTFAVRGAVALPVEVQEEQLVVAMWAAIENALAKHEKTGATLYWRKRPVIEHDGSAVLRMRFGIEGFSAIGHNPTREDAGE